MKPFLFRAFGDGSSLFFWGDFAGSGASPPGYGWAREGGYGPSFPPSGELSPDGGGLSLLITVHGTWVVRRAVFQRRVAEVVRRFCGQPVEFEECVGDLGGVACDGNSGVFHGGKFGFGGSGTTGGDDGMAHGTALGAVAPAINPATGFCTCSLM